MESKSQINLSKVRFNVLNAVIDQSINITLNQLQNNLM
jgi:hypothetical protein